MYLSVMRLQRPNAGPWGVNIYTYWHPAGLPADHWKVVADPGPDDRARRQIELPPGGNRVQAYVDVILDDRHYSLKVIEAALDQMAATIAGGAPNPVRDEYVAEAGVERIFVRFGMNNQWADRSGMSDDYNLLRKRLMEHLQTRLPELPDEAERIAAREPRRAAR